MSWLNRNNQLSIDCQKRFDRGIALKRQGGVELTIYVPDRLWLGGLCDQQKHEPFVAIGPEAYDSEEEMTFFKTSEEVDDFIRKLEEVKAQAFK